MHVVEAPLPEQDGDVAVPLSGVTVTELQVTDLFAVSVIELMDETVAPSTGVELESAGAVLLLLPLPPPLLPVTVHERLATAPVFPAPSVALTSNVCEPAARPLKLVGLLQEPKALVSRRHWKLEPLSLELKANSAVVALVLEPAAGPELIVAVGADVSTVQVRLAGVGSVLEAPSRARTSKVCDPSVSPLTV